jgi:hypothetical protein
MAKCCGESSVNPLTWNDPIDQVWGTCDLTWGDYTLVIEAFDRCEAEQQWPNRPLDQLTDEEKKKKKRLIQLIAYVKDNRIVQEKEVTDATITVEDITLTKAYLEKQISIGNIKFNPR